MDLGGLAVLAGEKVLNLRVFDARMELLELFNYSCL